MQPHIAIRADRLYIALKFLVDMTKSGSTRSRSFLLPRPACRRLDDDETAGHDRATTASSAKAASMRASPRSSSRCSSGIGYRLVRVRLSGQNGLTLQIMAERDGRHDDRRGLRGGQPRRSRRCSMSRTRSTRPIISKCRRPASTGRWCAGRISTRWAGHLVKMRDVDPGRRPQALPRQDRRGRRRRRHCSSATRPAYGDEPTVRDAVRRASPRRG